MLLLDAGAIVGLLDRSDRHHRRCASGLLAVREGLATTWPVVAEALERLGDVEGGTAAVWELLERSQCRLLALDRDDIPRIRELTQARRSRLSLAQASLVRVAERDGIDAIFTLDNRLAGRRRGRGRLFRRRLGGGR